MSDLCDFLNADLYNLVFLSISDLSAEVFLITESMYSPKATCSPASKLAYCWNGVVSCAIDVLVRFASH